MICVFLYQNVYQNEICGFPSWVTLTSKVFKVTLLYKFANQSY